MLSAPARRPRASSPGPLARAAATAAALAGWAATGSGRDASAEGKAAAATTTPPDAAVEGRRQGVAPGTRLARRVAAADRRQGPVTVDGRLDEAAWRAATSQNDFWQREPHEGGASRFTTEFRVLFDEDALYVGVRAFDPEPHLIRGLLTRRDVQSSSDWISVKIDSYHDRRTAFAFSVNPAGVQLDELVFNDIEYDPSWDAVWESGAHTDRDGWTAELRIPYGQLRFPSAIEQRWGLQVMRRVHRTQELSVWSRWPKDVMQEVSLYGSVVGIRGVAPTRRVELVPYALAGGRLYSPENADPLLDGHDGVTGLGLDLKFGLGPNFTLSGTINPDFGQVEADPSKVNLSASEIFLAEKRPFFVEGTDIFRFSLAQGDGDDAVETLFYTRRIGAPPHTDPYDHGDYVDAPDVTTIYGAAKLSGKTAGGWSVGLLDAVTGQEDGVVVEEGGGAADAERLILEPLTNYAVARVRKDLREGRTTIGAALTSVHRSLDGTGLPLHDEAYTGGLHVEHRFWQDRWNADLRLAGSYVHGSPEAIDETQTSSVHYFQRPDADHLDYDPTRTSLTGASALWSFGKSAGGHWRGTVGGDLRTPGFETNDIGYQRNGDYYLQWVWAQYREEKPGKVLRSYWINFNGWRMWDTSPEVRFTGGNFNGTVNFTNYWGGNAGVGIDDNVRDPYALRGGPNLRRDPTYPVWIGMFSDPRRPVSVTANAIFVSAPFSDSRYGEASSLVTVQAGGNLELSAGPAWSYNLDDNQYVDEVDDTAGQPRYILGRIRQVTTGLTLRASYTFSPRMGLQLYAQPFISTGRYLEYKEPADPLAREYDDRYHTFAPGEFMDDGDIRSVDRNGDGVADFEFERADFNFRELRSNLVFRWEYRPGSTFFLIWSHGRTSDPDVTDGRFQLRDDLSALADESGEHAVLAKLNYWFGL